jgi:hypothetical protein
VQIGRRIAERLVAIALFASAVYESAVAVKWIPMGLEPGSEAPGQVVVTIGAFVALAAGSAMAASVAYRGYPVQASRWRLIPIAAAAYVTARFYAFDSYYLPSLRRFSEQGSVSPLWLYGVALCALLVGTALGVRPRIGLALTPFVLFACAVTVVAEGIGH